MKSWSLPTRVLHLGIAISIVVQLLISLVMEFPDTPEKAQGIEATFFEAHEVVGIIAVLFVLLHWLWIIKSPDNRFADLFPWGAASRQRIFEELQRTVKGEQLDGGPKSGGLVGMVHGLGLLLAAAMALTGLVLFFILPDGGAKAGNFAEIVEEVHAALATLVWIYVIAHALMALRHHFSGHATLRDMFKL